MYAIKNNIITMPKFFDKYINLVEEPNLIISLNNGLDNFVNFDFNHLYNIGNKTYEQNKWTIKNILQHINDNERIQSYRALRIARKDKTMLPGYDENLLANNSFAENRNLEDIKEEFILLRKSSINLFKSLNLESLLESSLCSNIQISALALGFVIVGHQIHHFNVIKEKYWHL